MVRPYVERSGADEFLAVARRGDLRCGLGGSCGLENWGFQTHLTFWLSLRQSWNVTPAESRGALPVLKRGLNSTGHKTLKQP